MKLSMLFTKDGRNMRLETDTDNAEGMIAFINLREAALKNGWKFESGEVEDTKQTDANKTNQSGQ